MTKDEFQKTTDSVGLVSDHKRSGTFEIVLDKIEGMKKYDSVECHLVLYPYSDEVSSRDFVFTPYEEYVRDILVKQRSAYAEMTDRFGNFFGLFLGIVIIAVFAIFKPEDLLSVESLVSVIGSYLIGKEIWDDIENILINLTKKMTVRMVENYYRFQLEKHSTLTLYSLFAKKRRYGRETLVPEKIDFIQHSNSQTLRLCFSKREIRKIPGSSALMVTLSVTPDKITEFLEKGWLFGVKLSLNKSFICFKKSVELFQSLDGQKKGCLDESGNWHEGSVFERKTFTFWKIKAFLSKKLTDGFSLVYSKSE